MVKVGTSSLVLGFLLKIMLFMRHSSAQSPHFQGGDQVGEANDHHTMLGYNVEPHSNQKKEIAAFASMKSKTVIIGGRKMILDHKASCKETENEESKEGKDPAPSQESRRVANDPCNQQKTTKISGPKDKVFSGKMGIPRSDVDDHQAHNIPSTKTEGYPPDPKATPADHHNPTAESSSQRHLEVEAANDEILNLMHKDYRGFPKPRRKPPINNHEPSN